MVWTWGGLAAVGLAACGGSVTVEPDGSGGAGGAGTGNVGNTSSTGAAGNVGNGGPGGFPSSSSGAGNTGPTTTSGGTGNSTGSGGASSFTCFDACEVLWSCGAANNFALCPGFASIDGNDFIEGCIVQCEQIPALVSIVDESDCSGTISIVSGASQEFDFACQVGNPPG